MDSLLNIDTYADGWESRLPIALSAKGAPRISPDNPDVVEVECTFEQFPLGLKRTVWLPLTEVMAMPPGHVIHKGRMNIERPPLDRIKAQGFVPRSSATGFRVSHALAGIMPNDARIASQSLQAVEFWVDDMRAKPVAIPKEEYTRFVLAGFGSFLEHLIGLDVDPEQIFAIYCDPSRTGLDGNVFRVAPHPEHANRATIFQLAVLKCQPDCLKVSTAE